MCDKTVVLNFTDTTYILPKHLEEFMCHIHSLETRGAGYEARIETINQDVRSPLIYEVLSFPMST